MTAGASQPALFVIVAFSVAFGAVAGAGLVMSSGDVASEPDTEDTPSVSCTTFIEEGGNASGMCFVKGDVEFEWLDERNSTNGTITMDGLPDENSTVRKESR